MIDLDLFSKNGVVSRRTFEPSDINDEVCTLYINVEYRKRYYCMALAGVKYDNLRDTEVKMFKDPSTYLLMDVK